MYDIYILGERIEIEDTLEVDESSYKAMLQLHEYVTNTLGQKSIIIDADELKEKPGTDGELSKSGSSLNLVNFIRHTENTFS